MPFIILCGYPCSGKTTRSLELKEYFENTKHLRTIIISEHDRELQRNFLYSGILYGTGYGTVLSGARILCGLRNAEFEQRIICGMWDAE